jgi:hypothetical protein
MIDPRMCNGKVGEKQCPGCIQGVEGYQGDHIGNPLEDRSITVYAQHEGYPLPGSSLCTSLISLIALNT